MISKPASRSRSLNRLRHGQESTCLLPVARFVYLAPVDKSPEHFGHSNVVSTTLEMAPISPVEVDSTTGQPTGWLP